MILWIAPSSLEAIREGFPQTVVEEVMHAVGITRKELAATLVSRASPGRSICRDLQRLTEYPFGIPVPALGSQLNPYVVQSGR